MSSTHLRLLAFALLISVTLYGVWHGFASDWQPVLEAWRNKAPALGLALLLSLLDVVLDIWLWVLVCAQFGINNRDKTGVLIFLSMYAGTLLPAQMGRLLRPDAISQLQRGSIQAALKVEAVSFYLAATAAAAFLAGVIGYAIHPLLAVVGMALAILVLLGMANRFCLLLTDTPLEVAPSYWLQSKTLLLVGLAMLGWLLHGLVLYTLVYDLPGTTTLLGALFAGPGSTVLGMGTGLPGGIGAIESFLGLSLKEVMEVSGLHLALTIGAFRLITFWVWLPLGWLSLGAVNHVIARAKKSIF